MRPNGTMDWTALGPKLRLALLFTAGALILFYAGLLALPPFVHALASRSIYNYRDLADQAVARGNYDEAIAIIERAAREIPRDIYFERPEFMFDRIGRIRKEEGRVAESLGAFLRAQSLYFRNVELQGYVPPPRLIREIIDAYFEMSNYAGACQEARIAMDMYPPMKEQFSKAHELHAIEDPRIMRDLGVLELKLGRIPSAQARLRQSLVRDPKIAESHYHLGQIAEGQKSYDAAIAEYRAELSNHPLSENAFDRFLEVSNILQRKTGWIAAQHAERRAKAFAQFVNEKNPYEPVASLFGVGAAMEKSFDLAEPAAVLVSILARSTPSQGLYGWVELTLDGRHIQTIYVDTAVVRGYDVWMNTLDAGRHTFRLEDLSDAMDALSDRNVFIHSVRLFRVP